jgi:UDPglucose 6-dehydrogenase
MSVVGLGKLGSCLAATLGNAGYSVIGADLDESVVDALNEGQSPFPEPKMDEYLASADNRIRATTDTREAVLKSDVTFIVVNTPSTPAGRYSLDAVAAVCEEVGAAIGKKDDYHLTVLTSTVFPGDTTGDVRPILEEASGKTASEDFGLCYSPEFIAIGNVIEGLEEPDFFLIGEDDERAGDVLASIYERIRKNDAPIARMPPVEAEIAKMAVNSYVTMKISFANTLAQVCDGTDARVDDVTDALALDERIGSRYLDAGARYGGPCFPRDNVAFAQLAEDAGTQAPLAESTDRVNDAHTDWIAETVRDVTPASGRVGLLGMTYKPGTYIITESQGADLAAMLDGEYDLACHDPMGLNEVRGEFGDRVVTHESVDSLLESVDTAVLTTLWDDFTTPDAYDGFSGWLVDPWRRLDTDELPDSVQYAPVGNGRMRSGRLRKVQ